MTSYVAFLRGINVGGHRKIKMADLRLALEASGLQQVQTYIQSGNVVFVSDLEATVLHQQIEQVIEETFGFAVQVVLRTASQLNTILRDCPFSEEMIAKAVASAVGECLYVAMLGETPTQEKIEQLRGYQSEQEKFAICEQNIYLLFYQSVRNAKLARQIEKLGVTVTVRNWKTMNKLNTMAVKIVD